MVFHKAGFSCYKGSVLMRQKKSEPGHTGCLQTGLLSEKVSGWIKKVNDSYWKIKTAQNFLFLNK